MEEELQRLAPGRRAKGEEGLFDLLRELGPMTVEDLARRHTGSSEEIASYLENLLAVKRIFPTMISGQERLACMDDAARLRDALGVRLPESLPEIYLHRVSYPLRDLFLRYLRAHALVTAEQLAHEFSLGIAIVEEQLQQLREQGLVMNLQQDIWVSDEVFRRLRLRSLQAAREATRPVAATTYARLLLERQGVLPATDGSPALFASTSPGVYEGVDGVMRVIEQLAGVGLPASLWESQILPARVRDYSPEMLDELLATGAVIWSGQKSWVKMTVWWHCIYRNMPQNRSLPPKRIRRIVRHCSKRSSRFWLTEEPGLHNKSANGYAIKSANRLIPQPCKRRYGRWSGKASSPATFGHRYAPSPTAVPTHAPQLAAVTGLVVDVLSMRNPSRRGYLTTHQSLLDAGRYCRWSH